MLHLLGHVDRLLRGEITTVQALRDGLRVSATGLLLVVLVLGTVYGACMGLFAVTGAGSDSWLQIPASMVKLPMLFLLTLVVTFPSLYVFNALVGSRLTFTQLLRLLVGAMTVMLAVLASLGPIVAFFSVSTTSYAFMVLLNVVVCAVSGVLGLSFLLQTLHRIAIAASPPMTPPPPQTTSVQVETTALASPADPPLPVATIDGAQDFAPSTGALDPVEGYVPQRQVRTIFRIWVLVFALVGAQMSWVLRPFVGSPDKPFTFFRERQGNFFQAVVDKTGELFDPTRKAPPKRADRDR